MIRADYIKSIPKKPTFWLITFVVSYAFIALVVFDEVFIELFFQKYFPILISSLPAVFMIALVIGSIIDRPRSPLIAMVERLFSHGIQAFVVAVLACIFITGFTTFKIKLIPAMGFYADPFLADLDLWLHGKDPWRYAHELLPAKFSLIILKSYVEAWGILWFFSIFYAVLFVDNNTRNRYFATYIMIFALMGTIMATIGSSAGPILYDRVLQEDRFADFITRLAEHPDPYMKTIIGTARYLFHSYENNINGIGTGISAMPSIHVALVVLNALFYYHLNVWLGLVAWGFAIIIMFGSVYTGFHYAVDAYVSLFSVCLIWWVAGRLIGKQVQDEGYMEPVVTQSYDPARVN